MKTQLNIVAGENIPYVKEAFGGLGNLRILPGRVITSSELNDTNILLIRSITPVNEVLLKGTSVEFIGSASAGTDHMDTAYLQSRNIGFASAPGANANSVAEYVIAAWFEDHRLACTKSHPEPSRQKAGWASNQAI